MSTFVPPARECAHVRTAEQLLGSIGCLPHQRFMERLKATPPSYVVWEQHDLATVQRRYRFLGLEWLFEGKNRRGGLK